MEDQTEWGDGMAKVIQDGDGRWRLHTPLCQTATPLVDGCATYDTWEQAALVGQLLYGDVVVFK